MSNGQGSYPHRRTATARMHRRPHCALRCWPRSPATRGAFDVDYEIGLAAKHSDNINLSENDPISDTVLSPATALRSRTRTGHASSWPRAATPSTCTTPATPSTMNCAARLPASSTGRCVPQRMDFVFQDYLSRQPDRRTGTVHAHQRAAGQRLRHRPEPSTPVSTAPPAASSTCATPTAMPRRTRPSTATASTWPPACCTNSAPPRRYRPTWKPPGPSSTTPAARILGLQRLRRLRRLHRQPQVDRRGHRPGLLAAGTRAAIAAQAHPRHWCGRRSTGGSRRAACSPPPSAIN